jgi:hypothetical protein
MGDPQASQVARGEAITGARAVLGETWAPGERVSNGLDLRRAERRRKGTLDRGRDRILAIDQVIKEELRCTALRDHGLRTL